MKYVALVLTLAFTLALAACECDCNHKDTAGNAQPLGDSDVHVSGHVQTGGSTSPR